MIDNLISYPKNKFRLIWSLILNIINLIIFKDFSRIFLILYKFIWIYFELKRIKKSDLYRMLTWQLTWHERKWHHHVAAYEHAIWCTCMCVRMCARLRVLACV